MGTPDGNRHDDRRGDGDPRHDRDAHGHRAGGAGSGTIHHARRDEPAISWPALALVALAGLVLWYALTPPAGRHVKDAAAPAVAPRGGDAATGSPAASAASRRARPEALRLDDAYLSSFGEFHVPTALWIALQRYTVWIEPAIEAEWARLMQRFAEGQGRTIDRTALARAMVWPDPARDVRVARERALALIETTDLRCAWSDKRLTPTTLAMDHCLPFAVWSCDDLWNLLPTHADVNRGKSDRLPSARKLRDRQGAILEWWQQGYCAPDAPALRARFETEARASLPCLSPDTVTPAEVFSGLLSQHLRLRHDQQAPVWEG